MPPWDRFKDIGDKVERMYERITGQLERIIAILEDMAGFVRDTAYWFDEEEDSGGRDEDN